ncbi:MAG: hypothetical protein ACLQFR_26425 [Streptosporangiaceae bacterium]
MPLSSAFLYVGIVAIWAFVLVPRWLRRPQALPEPADEYEGSYQQDAGHGEREEGEQPDYEQRGHARDDYGRREDARLEDAPGSANPGSVNAAAAIAADAATASGRAGGQPVADRRSVPPLPRSRVLQARRRLLTLLVLLCAAAGACTAVKLTTWWACIPPAGMLGLYLLLLRETALADAEQARRRAVLELRVQAARQRAHSAWAAAGEEHSAQIIDISGRVGDQLYDQYADATIRAVGD